jgi:hypothetical protein
MRTEMPGGESGRGTALTASLARVRLLNGEEGVPVLESLPELQSTEKEVAEVKEEQNKIDAAIKALIFVDDTKLYLKRNWIRRKLSLQHKAQQAVATNAPFLDLSTFCWRVCSDLYLIREGVW